MAEITKQNVLDYLAAHPQFLAHSPEVYDLQRPLDGVPAEGFGGSKVYDFSSAMIGRLKQRIRHLELERQSLVESDLESVQKSEKLEAAILGLASQPSLERCLDWLGSELAQVIGHDQAVVALECDRKFINFHQAQGFYRLTPGSVNRVMSDQVLSLSPIATFEAMVFGKMATNVRSSCLIRLDIPRLGVSGILGFGEPETGVFEPNSKCQELTFFARYLEKVLDQWMPTNVLETGTEASNRN